MAADLNILITAKDQASSVIADVKGEVAGLDEAGSRAGRGMGALGGVLKGGLALGAGAAIAGVGALGAVIGSSIGDAMAAQEAQAQLEAVIASTGGAAGLTADQIQDMALSLSEVTRFEDDAIVSGQNMLLTFTNIGKDVFPQATEAMLNLSQSMGQDLKSSAIQLGKALNDPVQGVTALQRVGVSFTEAQKDQIKALADSETAIKELNERFMEAQKILTEYPVKIALATEKLDKMKASGKATDAEIAAQEMALGKLVSTYDSATDTLDGYTEMMQELQDPVKQNERLMQAQTLILEELERQFGNSARAAGETLPGQLDILKNQLGNVKEEIGTAFLPMLTEMAQTLGPVVIEAAKGLADFIVNRLVPAIGEAAAWFKSNLLPALQTVGGFIQTSVIPILQTVWTWLATNLPPVIQALAAFWNDTLLPAIKAVWAFLEAYVIPIIKTLVETWFVLLRFYLEALARFWDSVLLPAIKAVWGFLEEYIMPILADLVEIGIALLKIALQELSDLWTGTLKPALEAVWQFIKDNILPIFQDIIDKLNGPLTAAMNAIKGVIQGVVDFFGRLYDAVRDAIDAIREFLNLESRAGRSSAPAGRGMETGPATGRAPLAGAGLALASAAGVGLAAPATASNVYVIVRDNQFGSQADVDYMLKQLDRRLRMEGGILPL